MHPDGQDAAGREPHAHEHRPALRQVRGGDAARLPQLPRGHRAHRGDRPALSGGVRLLHHPPAQIPAAGGRDRRHRLPARAVRGRNPPALRRGTQGRVGQAQLRAGRDREDGLRGLLPDRLGLHSLRQDPRRGGRPWARQRRGLHRGLLAGHHRDRSPEVQPAVRALPEPGAHLHARHRLRLRLRAPGSGDRLRAPALRCGSCGADHHLRHDGRPRGAAGRGPGAGHELPADRYHRQAGAL